MSEKAPDPDELVDGRRQRTLRSRRQIVDAMLALVGEGEMHPSAAQVAARANVGLRSVFRHFEDMDTLYREMSARLEAEILPLATAPFEAKDWRGRLRELLQRRAGLFDRILPYRVAGAVRRFQSAYLMEDYRRTLAFEQAALRAVLPKTILADAALLAALELAAGFESWRALRQDYGLSRRKAEEVVRASVEGLIRDR